MGDKPEETQGNVLNQILQQLGDMKKGQDKLKDDLTDTIKQSGDEIRQEVQEVKTTLSTVEKKVNDCTKSVEKQEKRIDQVERDMRKRTSDLEQSINALREGTSTNQDPLDQRAKDIEEFRTTVGLKPVIQRHGESDTAAFLRTLGGLNIDQELLEGFPALIVEQKRSTGDHEKLMVRFSTPHPVNVITAHAANRNNLVVSQHAPGDLYKELEPLAALAFWLRKYVGPEEGRIRTNIKAVGRTLILEAGAKWSRGKVIIPPSLIEEYQEGEDERDVQGIVDFMRDPGETDKQSSDPGSRRESEDQGEDVQSREDQESDAELVPTTSEEPTTSDEATPGTQQRRGVKRGSKTLVRRAGLVANLSVSSNDDTPRASRAGSSSDEGVETTSESGSDAGVCQYGTGDRHNTSILRAGDSDAAPDMELSTNDLILDDSRNHSAVSRSSNHRRDLVPTHRSLSRLNSNVTVTQDFYQKPDTNVKVISESQRFVLNKKKLASKYLEAANIKDWKIHEAKAPNPKTGEKTSLKIEFNTGVFHAVVKEMFTNMARKGWEVELANDEGKFAVTSDVMERRDRAGTITRYEFTVEKIKDKNVLLSVHLHVHMTNQTCHIQSNDAVTMWEDLLLPLLVEESRKKEYKIKMYNETVRRIAKPGNACASCGNPLHTTTKKTCRQCMKSVHMKCIASGVCMKCKEKAKAIRGEMAATTPESSGFWKKLESARTRSEGRQTTQGESARDGQGQYQSNIERWLATRYEPEVPDSEVSEIELDFTEMLPAVPQPGTMTPQSPLRLENRAESIQEAPAAQSTPTQIEREGEEEQEEGTGTGYKTWSPQTMDTPTTTTTTPPTMVQAGRERSSQITSLTTRVPTIVTRTSAQPRMTVSTLSPTAATFTGLSLGLPQPTRRQLTLGPPRQILPRLMGPTPQGRAATPRQRTQQTPVPHPAPRDQIYEEQAAKIALLEEEMEALRGMNDTYRRAAMQKERGQGSGPLVEQTFNINCKGEGDTCNVVNGEVGNNKNPHVKEKVNQPATSREQPGNKPAENGNETASPRTPTQEVRPPGDPANVQSS